MRLHTFSRFACAIGLIFQSAVCFASSLEIQIDSPTRNYGYKGQTQFKLLVTFSNSSAKSFVVFPYLVRRKYVPLDGQNVRFLPYPGPKIDPWYSAITLHPGQKKTIIYNGMKNGDGKWRLNPGRYKLSVTLDVPNSSYYPSLLNSAHSRSLIKNGKKDIDVWHGSAVSNSIRINYSH